MPYWEARRRAPVYAERAMVATSHLLASQTAWRLLQAGGSAVDAAIGAALTQCVVEPQSVGLGGDAFALIAEAGKLPVRAYNGSGAAPQGFDLEAARRVAQDGRIPRTSAQAVTLPAAIDAFSALHAAYGKLLWDALFEDAIAYAETGFIVAQRVAHDWAGEAGLPGMDPRFRTHYLPDGQAPKAGARMAFPKLAKTLRQVARLGRDGFYEGWIAEDLCATLNQQGGAHQPEDFARVEGEWVEPISASIAGHQVFQCPPNGQGIAALMMMQALSQQKSLTSPEGQVAQLAVARQVYALRDRYLADGMPGEQIDQLLSVGLAQQIRGLELGSDLLASGPPLLAGPDTVYITVVDEARLTVSLMASLFHPFGSTLMGEASGVVLHSRGSGFSLDPEHPNCAAPGKRPLHTIIPALAADEAGRLRYAFGVMGGQYQPQGQAQVLLAMLRKGLDPQRALDLPRLHWNPILQRIEVEPGIDADRLAKQIPGHNLYPIDALGGGQVIEIREDAVLVGGSDARKDGAVLGL